MYFCYVDESGTAAIPGNTSHFILAGLAIPIEKWRDADRDVSRILGCYGLDGQELHTGWILRSYLEQSRISGFEQMGRPERRSAMERQRNSNLLALQKTNNRPAYRQVKKNYSKTKPYVHLTLAEGEQLIREVADCVSGWNFAKLFAECVDKIHYDPSRTNKTIDEQAFEQVVSRFERFLQNMKGLNGAKCYGLLVHDNNQTVARKHTELMRRFHKQGTLWTEVDRLIETPMFVDSSLTSMVQVADLCSYALRRYLENNEEDLFKKIFARADRIKSTIVGVRHFTEVNCVCEICLGHRPKPSISP